jgi:hypothetical protein
VTVEVDRKGYLARYVRDLVRTAVRAGGAGAIAGQGLTPSRPRPAR